VRGCWAGMRHAPESEYCTTIAVQTSSCPLLLHSDHDARVLVPGYQRVIAVPCARLCDIRPARHEVLVCICAREFTRDGCVHGLHDLEVGGEEDVEVALMNLVLVSTRLEERNDGLFHLPEV
jgi:hypothetical protein